MWWEIAKALIFVFFVLPAIFWGIIMIGSLIISGLVKIYEKIRDY